MRKAVVRRPSAAFSPAAAAEEGEVCPHPSSGCTSQAATVGLTVTPCVRVCVHYVARVHPRHELLGLIR